MAVTIEKIAELAGVSRGTVDRALHGRKGVNQQVAEDIINIAKEHGYKPNKAARALATKGKGKYKIGIIINSEGNPFYDEVKLGIHRAQLEFADFGFEIVTRKLKGYHAEKQIRAIDEIIREGATGIAITPISHPTIVERLNQVIEGGVPVVTINTDICSVDRMAYVGCDYLASGKTAAALMGMALGKRSEVAVVIGSSQVLGHGQRLAGFKEVLTNEFKDIDIVATVENEDNERLSYKVVKDLLIAFPNLSGVYFTAAGVQGGITAISDMGLQKKMTIITCDMTTFGKQKLQEGVIDATICQEPFRQGYDSLKILFDHLISGEKPSGDIITKLEIKLKYNIG